MIKFDKNEFLKPQIYSTLDEYESRCIVTEEIVEEIKQLQQENQQLRNQQREFIKYLEEPIKLIKEGNPINISEYTSGKLDTLEKILQKYKSIIGGKENENND